MAHAPMEPLSCLVELREDGGAKITTGSQMLGGDHPAVAATDLGSTSPEKVEIRELATSAAASAGAPTRQEPTSRARGRRRWR